MLFNRTNKQIDWQKPQAISPASKSNFYEAEIQLPTTENLFARDVSPQSGFGLIESIRQQGLPFIPGATPDEELIEFLKEAAEVEHGLMIQYLYATSATTNPQIAGIISQIAIEEMGHLLTVQNLLLALGQQPYLGRYDSGSSHFQPFHFLLEPLTKLTIAKYAACERPDDYEMDEGEKEIIQQILQDARSSSGGATPERVGLLYAKIYWLLRATDEPLANPVQEEWPDFPVTLIAAMFPANAHVATYPRVADPVQGQRNDWYASNPDILILDASTRQLARQAIAQISAQGEGFASETRSHFDRFVAAYRVAMSDPDIARNVPFSPWYQTEEQVPAPVPTGNEINSKDAVIVARIADGLYEILLNGIVLALQSSALPVETRSVFAKFCLDLMRKGLRSLTKNAQDLPIDDAGHLLFAPCYTLPQSPADDTVAANIRKAIHAITELCTKLADSDDFNLSIAADDIKSLLDSAPDFTA